MSAQWLPITEEIKDGRIVYVRSPRYPGPHLMSYSRERNRWEGLEFAIARKIKTWWDEKAEQPNEYSTIPA